MKTITTTAVVAADGMLTVQLPPSIPPGEHDVVIVIAEELVRPRTSGLADFPVISVGPWPEDLSLRREDMYDDWGR
ncbi:MAG: hypothetical protein IT340_19570 [Chloroflexi bacterium]|nr:hypothetical protein [Chloroflexota bacterium]